MKTTLILCTAFLLTACVTTTPVQCERIMQRLEVARIALDEAQAISQTICVTADSRLCEEKRKYEQVARMALDVAEQAVVRSCAEE